MALSGADARQSDAELAARIAEADGGAPEAEAELCARFAPRVRAYGLRHLGDPSGADDLVQRVLLLTLEKLRQGAVRQPERIASFVLGSARLTASAMRRKDARNESLDADHPVARAVATDAAEPLDRDRLAACLAQLPERERSVVVLSFFEGATAAEIGKSLDMAPGHVRVVRHRALAQLRTLLTTGEAGHA